jgi:fatty-acyl-CoA synthase
MGYANILACRMRENPVYLWTLPMFHCNGWCFPWTLALIAGTHVCLRWVRAKEMYQAIEEHNVTHLSGAPTVMAALLNAKPEERRPLSRKVNFVHAAAPPPEAILLAMLEAGFELTHVYGLTETYGPATVNAWHEEWDRLPLKEHGAKRIRQGVPYPALEQLTVLDPAPCGARATRRPDPWRSHVSRQYRDEGLSEESKGNAGSHGGRLVPLRGPRRHAP